MPNAYCLSPLVSQAVQRRGNPSPAPDERRSVQFPHGNHRGVAQQTAELHVVADPLAGGGDHADGGRLVVDHADGGLVGDDGRDGRGGGMAGDGDPDSLRAETVTAMCRFVELYEGAYDRKRLIQRYRKFDPITIYRDGRSMSGIMAGYKKYLHAAWALYNGSSVKAALPIKF